MRRILRGLGIVLALLCAYAGALYALAEWDEVVILRSRAETGELEATHLWVVDGAGAAWLRSSGRERGWFVRVGSNPEVELELVEGGWTPVAVRLDPR